MRRGPREPAKQRHPGSGAGRAFVIKVCVGRRWGWVGRDQGMVEVEGGGDCRGEEYRGP